METSAVSWWHSSQCIPVGCLWVDWSWLKLEGSFRRQLCIFSKWLLCWNVECGMNVSTLLHGSCFIVGGVAKATEPFATSCIVLFHTARALQAAGISRVCRGAQYSFWYNALQVLPVEKGRKRLEMFVELCGPPPLYTQRPSETESGLSRLQYAPALLRWYSRWRAWISSAWTCK